MLALASRVTGEWVAEEWLDGDFTVVPVHPVDDDPTTTINPPTEALTYDDGPLAWALLHAGDAAQRRVAGIAARYAADEAARHDARKAGGRNASALGHHLEGSRSRRPVLGEGRGPRSRRPQSAGGGVQVRHRRIPLPSVTPLAG